MSSKEVEITTTAIRVQQRPSHKFMKSGGALDPFQNLYDFFVFSLPSTTLLDIAKFLERNTSKEGIQRQHIEERDKEIGNFICSEHPFFPNGIILNIPLEFNESFYDLKTRTLTFTIPKKSAYVIDGQHRLRAFESSYSGGVMLPLVVTAYFGLELPTMAEIFTRINFFQRPVSKSLVYDMLRINKDPGLVKFAQAHAICEELNGKAGSPFYGLIKMLGIGDGLLSQAAFVEALSTRYKIIPMLKPFFDHASLRDFIERYFSSVKLAFPKKWGTPKSVLSSTVGFNALVKVLAAIIRARGVKNMPSQKFEVYAAALAKVDVDSRSVTMLGGFKGVNELASLFEKELMKKGLL